MKRLLPFALFLVSCGDPLSGYREAQYYKVQLQAPRFRSLVGKSAPRVELPDQYGAWHTIPPRGRPCVVFFADRDLVDLLERWKDAARERYKRLPVRWVVRQSSERAILKATQLVRGGTRLHSDVAREFESGWGVELRGVYVFAVDKEGVVKVAVRGAWTAEKMRELSSVIDGFKK